MTIGMIVCAQTNQVITKPLKLDNVKIGSASDSILVIGSDKVVKFRPSSTLKPILKLQDVINNEINVAYGGSIEDNLGVFINKESSTIELGGDAIDESVGASMRVFNGKVSLSQQDKQTGYVNTLTFNNPISSNNFCLPAPIGTMEETKYNIPISVNGVKADANGNIEIAGGSYSTPTLQQVFDAGSNIITDTAGVISVPPDNNGGYYFNAFSGYGINVGAAGANNTDRSTTRYDGFRNYQIGSYPNNRNSLFNATSIVFQNSNGTKTLTYDDNANTIETITFKLPSKSTGDYYLATTKDFPIQGIQEGNGIGFAPNNRVVDNYGNIGLNSLDLTISNAPSTTKGVTNDQSLGFGDNVTVNGYASIGGGLLTNNQGDYSINIGMNNKIGITSQGVSAFGVGNEVSGLGTFVVGQAAEVIGNSTLDFNPSSKQIFVVGNGTIANNDPNYTVTSRHNAFSVDSNGSTSISATGYGNSGMYILTTGDNGDGISTTTGGQNSVGLIINQNNNNSGYIIEGKHQSTDKFLVSKEGNVTANKYGLMNLNNAPTSSTDTGTTGEIRYTSTGIFWCIATNSWIKVTGTTF